MISRDELILEYIDRLQHAPYPVQEEALYAWAGCQDGILLSAPTGTGKTLVAEAAVYEGLRTGKSVYYSTPLIALTDQKLIELQDTVQRWGYSKDQVGLVTGHRTVNPDAPIKVVVAEVLLNRLLHQKEHSFESVGAVVMDEFHNFNELQRGMVWELSLALLPAHIRVMLLSATVGGAQEFVNWIAKSLNRQLTLVEGKERKVPLHFNWVGDELLPDFVERISQGKDVQRRTPALVFCFDREMCWNTAEVLRGKDLFAERQRSALLERLEAFDFAIGSGNRLRTFLARGIGIHHAGLLPRYRRVVETLFQEKLLSICVCTETLAAGINLPAKSVILSTLVKGPKDRKKLIDVSAAQQMFGRAGRPQFDTEGHVFAIAHEDDVKIAKWKTKFDSIPEDTKDPGLLAARKTLLKKKPTRRTGVTYWDPEQFTKLQIAPPMKLSSKGRLSWRWLAYLLDSDPKVEPIRNVIRSRLMDQPTVAAELKRLTKMLVTLEQLHVVTLDPSPPASWRRATPETQPQEKSDADDDGEDEIQSPAKPEMSASAKQLIALLKIGNAADPRGEAPPESKKSEPSIEPYDPISAIPTPRMHELMIFKAVHPLYGLFLIDHLGQADDHELMQIMESLLEMPAAVARSFRVPWPDELPPGRLSLEKVDPEILKRGIASQDQMYPPADQSDLPPEERKYPIPLAEKVKLWFENEIDHAGGLFVTPVWAIGDLLHSGMDFDKFVRSRDVLKQEGILFKHMLRMILLCGEFSQLTPPGMDRTLWMEKMSQIASKLTELCRAVDPQSTDEVLSELESA